MAKGKKNKAIKKKVKVEIKAKVKTRRPKSDSLSTYRDMVMRPFNCVRSCRGAFSKTATNVFSIRQFVPFTTSANGDLFVCAQPCGINPTGGFVVGVAPAAMGALVTAADFSLVPPTNATTISALYHQYRALSGAIRVVNEASWANTQGMFMAGFLGPGAMHTMVGAKTYAQLLSCPLFNPVSPGEVVEILWGSQVAKSSADAFPCVASETATAANIFMTTTTIPYGTVWINATGFAANSKIMIEVVFHYEAVPQASVADFLEPDISTLTRADVDKVDMEVARSLSRSRLGLAALLDVPAAAGAQVAHGGLMGTNGAYTSYGAHGKHVPEMTLKGAINDLAVNGAVRLASKGVEALASHFNNGTEYVMVAH